MSRTARRARMERLVKRWRKSGDSANGFARANGIPTATFSYWKRRLESESRAVVASSHREEGSFLPIQLIGGSEVAVGLIELVLDGGDRVRFTEGVSEEALRQAVRVLREQC